MFPRGRKAFEVVVNSDPSRPGASGDRGKPDSPEKLEAPQAARMSLIFLWPESGMRHLFYKALAGLCVCKPSPDKAQHFRAFVSCVIEQAGDVHCYHRRWASSAEHHEPI